MPELEESMSTDTLLRQALLSDENDFLFAQHDLWHVSFKPATPHAGLFGSLAECGEAGCGCNRLTTPMARRNFRKALVQTALQAGLGLSTPIRYVSVGSGLLLFDLEILIALQQAGLQVESAALVDTAYSSQDAGEYSGHQSISDEGGARSRAGSALTELASFFTVTDWLAD